MLKSVATSTGGGGGAATDLNGQVNARVAPSGTTLLKTDRFVVYSAAGSGNYTLPIITGFDGVRITIKKTSSGALILNPQNAETIDGGTNATMTSTNMSLSLFSLNGAWYVW